MFTQTTGGNDESVVPIRVQLSTFSALHLSSGAALFVVLGRSTIDGKLVISFSDSNASLIRAPKAWVIELNEIETGSHNTLAAVAANLTAQTILSTATHYNQVIVHECTTTLATVLSHQALERDTLVRYTSSTANDNHEVTSIHKNASISTLKKLLPRQQFLLVDLSDGGSQALRQSVPTASVVTNTDDFFFSSLQQLS